MKKTMLICFILFILLFVSACSIEDACFLYTSYGSVDGIHVCINPFGKCCFVQTYFCEEFYDGMEIRIPDEYEGIPITRLGGFTGIGVPTPFDIYLMTDVPEDSPYYGLVYTDPSFADLTDPYTVEDLVFKLHLGKNIEQIDLVSSSVYYPSINEDGSITFLHPLVYICCAEDNPYFYSKDGKLYDKTTDTLIDVFDYAES